MTEAYERLERIGAGSFGVVEKIRRRGDGRVLCWKVMNYGTMSEKEKSLIVSEVNILRELRHPHIVRYYDRIIDKRSSKIYVIMEYAEGGDLGAHIKRKRREGKRFNEERIWRIFAQVLLAFEECHGHKEGGKPKPIVHRDVKPCNVLLDRVGNVKLGDFGLAKELPSASKFAYTNVGTPYYMPPEMVNEDRYNEKCDIWSIGCLLYELAALAPPFTAANQLALAIKINAGKFARIPAPFSDDLHNTIRWMLNATPSDRPSVDQLRKLPRVAYYVREGRLAVREYSLDRGYRVKMEEYTRRHEDLKRREHAVGAKEAELRARESTLCVKESELRKRTRDFEAAIQSGTKRHCVVATGTNTRAVEGRSTTKAASVGATLTKAAKAQEAHAVAAARPRATIQRTMSLETDRTSSATGVARDIRRSDTTASWRALQPRRVNIPTAAVSSLKRRSTSVDTAPTAGVGAGGQYARLPPRRHG